MVDVPLAGRKDELVKMIKAVNALRTDTAMDVKTLVLQAAAGMGKSALLKSFLKDVNASIGALVEVHQSGASQFEQNSPFHLFKQVFKDVLGLYARRPDTDRAKGSERVVAQDVLMAKLGELVGIERARDWHPLLNPVLPFTFPETSETEPLSSSARAKAAEEFFFEILQNSKKKLLLCLEDAHWADELSWGLIELCHESHDILVVLTTRPGDGEGEGGGLCENSGSSRVWKSSRWGHSTRGRSESTWLDSWKWR
jgi:predicted ATPase